jgi:hypothetical protein
MAALNPQWSAQQGTKPKRGRSLTCPNTCYQSSHDGLLLASEPLLNFAHKLRYGALPTTSTRKHLYWKRDTSAEGWSRITPPNKFRKSRKKLSKWVRKQHIYNTQECPSCNVEIETQEHLMTCHAHQPLLQDTARKIQSLIQNNAIVNASHPNVIPLWFHDGGSTQAPGPRDFLPFTFLARYDKHMGSMGYIPKALPEALRRYYGIKDPTFPALLSRTIIAGTLEVWKRRCKTLAASTRWRESYAVAKRFITNGLT